MTFRVYFSRRLFQSATTNSYSHQSRDVCVDGVPVGILEYDVPRSFVSQRRVPLRDVRRHPDHVAGLHRVPVIAEPVHPLTFQ